MGSTYLILLCWVFVIFQYQFLDSVTLALIGKLANVLFADIHLKKISTPVRQMCSVLCQPEPMILMYYSELSFAELFLGTTMADMVTRVADKKTNDEK